MAHWNSAANRRRVLAVNDPNTGTESEANVKSRILMVCSVLLAFILLFSCKASLEQNEELTPSSLLADYERLIPINQALQSGQWVVRQSDFPKVFGTYQSHQVAEQFICGDVCPQYGSVIIVYLEVAEAECASVLGDTIYSHWWGAQFEGCSPLTVRQGTLAQSGTGWSIVGEKATTVREPYNTPLAFDQASVCRRNGARVACSGFENGQSAKVVGRSSGGTIVVLTLDL